MGTGGSKPVKGQEKDRPSRRGTRTAARAPAAAADTNESDVNVIPTLKRRFHQFAPEKIDGVWCTTFEHVCNAVGLQQSTTLNNDPLRESLYLVFASLKGNSDRALPFDAQRITQDEFVDGILQWRAAVRAQTANPLFRQCLAVVSAGADLDTQETVDRIARLALCRNPPDDLPPVHVLTAEVRSASISSVKGTPKGINEAFCSWASNRIPSADAEAMHEAFRDVIETPLNDDVERAHTYIERSPESPRT